MSLANRMRRFGTQGRVRPDRHYIVPRTEEIADFISRVKEGRYIVLFAPRQTGKTTFFRLALDTLAAQAETWFPIQLNFEVYEDYASRDFYGHLSKRIRKEIDAVFRQRDSTPPEALIRFLDNVELTDHVSMLEFFERFADLIENQKVVLVIDEFDAIPPAAVRGFLHTLRHVYLSDEPRCPYSVAIVGVKSIAQLNYDRSISPFNIQDEFALPNFTREQVQDLLGQYTDEAGQAFASEVVEVLHRQTGGQPFLVNRLAQILTEELNIRKPETITIEHYANAHTRLLDEDNTNLTHLTTNIRRDPSFESLLMEIASFEKGVPFNPRNAIISELTTYGVIEKGADGLCEIVNPIYRYCVMQAFRPLFNGVEREYFSEDTQAGFLDYLTPAGWIDMESLLDNFRDFVARIGFRILQVPGIPRESVGQHLLATYLDGFVRSVRAFMYLEVPTGRGRTDLIVLHEGRKYVVETKVWGGEQLYRAGKRQLGFYLKSEQAVAGYYVVFDHRRAPTRREETETVCGFPIRSYVVPVLQERPSGAGPLTRRQRPPG